MPTTLTPVDFINRFNAVVAPLTAAFPPVHSTALDLLDPYLPLIPEAWNRNFYDMGVPAEPVFDATMLPAFTGDGAIIAAFHLLHRFAMMLTRVRMARHFYAYTTTSFVINEVAPTRMALKNGLELYFPPPPVLPAGSTYTAVDLDNFVIALAAAVQDRRTNMAYAHATLSSCHSSCHGACHGSRSRR